VAGLFDALGTATRGLQVIQQGMATTGHNIANADTEGYSRQRAVVATGTPQASRSGTIGSGAEQVSVERAVDRFVTLRLVSETSRLAEAESQAASYGEIESIVNDQLTGGMSGELGAFFSSLDDLASAAEPGQAVARSQVLASGESFIDLVHRWDSQFRSLQSDADQTVVGLVPEINNLIDGIAVLNGEILEAETLSPANDLRDRQEQLILELSSRIEISSLSDEQGLASIRLVGGYSLVERTEANRLEAVVDPANPNPSDPTFSQVYYDGGGSHFDITSQLTGGKLGAVLETRDAMASGAIADLDAFVYTFVDNFNTEHRNGFGLVDGAPHDFFQDMSGQATIDGSARQLRMADDIDPSRGGSIDNIAASASIDPATGAGFVGDTSQVEILKDLRTRRVTGYLAGDIPGAPTGSLSGISGSLIAMTSELGQQSRLAQRTVAQQEAVISRLQDRRDSISAVSIDEEVAGLVKLQASFQANARVVRTVTEMIQSLFDAF